MAYTYGGPRNECHGPYVQTPHDMTRTQNRREPHRISVMAVNSLRSVFADVVPRFEMAERLQVDVSFHPTASVIELMEDGAKPDLVVITDVGVDHLAALGLINEATVRNIASSELGAATARSSNLRVDVTSELAFTRSIDTASSIAYATKGASGRHFLEVCRSVGIADRLASKAVTIEGGLAGELVVEGRAEMAVQMIPELLAVAGLRVTEPLPSPFHTRLTLHAAQPFSVSSRDGAGAFTESLRSPTARSVLLERGFTV